MRALIAGWPVAHRTRPFGKKSSVIDTSAPAAITVMRERRNAWSASISTSGLKRPNGQALQSQRSVLLNWRRACPVLLRSGIWPCRAYWFENSPSLRQLASLDPVNLHACSGACLAGLCISPLDHQAEPRAVAVKCVIIRNEASVRSLLSEVGNLRFIGFPRYGPITCLVVPDVARPDAIRIRSYWPSCQTRSHRSNSSRSVTSSDIREFPSGCRSIAVRRLCVAWAGETS
jgi:hypothetical protein